MAQAEILYGGVTTDVLAPANVVAGEVILVGSLMCVATVAASSGELVNVYIAGVFKFNLKDATAVTAGAKLWFHLANDETETALGAGKTYLGIATIAAPSATPGGQVTASLNQVLGS